MRAGAGYSVLFNTFHKCSAVTGGGMVISDMQTVTSNTVASTIFTENTASDSLPCPADQCIAYQSSTAGSGGDGGAIYMERSKMLVTGYVTFPFKFENNYAANRGGAIFCQHPSEIASLSLITSYYFDSDYGASQPQMTEAKPGFDRFNYYNSFVNNVARVAGGAIAMNAYKKFSISGQGQGNGTIVYTLFQGNTAQVGGAISLVTTPSNLTQALFINNSAFQSSTADSGVGSYGCGLGQGGAVCLVGDNQTSTFLAESLIFYNNTAVFGGGMSVHASPSCSADQIRDGCFTATLGSKCNFSGNSAAAGGAGGAIFWAHQGNLVISCEGSHVAPQLMYGASSAHNVSLDVQPCDSWGKHALGAAGYGMVVASTPFFLTPGTSSVPFYRSNHQISMNVTLQVSQKMHEVL